MSKTKNRFSNGKKSTCPTKKSFFNKLCSWVLLLTVFVWSSGLSLIIDTPIAQAANATIVSVKKINPSTVEVTFSTTMDTSTATNIANYTFAGAGAPAVFDVFEESTTRYRVSGDGPIVSGTNTLTVSASVLTDSAGANTTTTAQPISEPVEVKISEISAEGATATEEFVEIHNASGNAADISGWLVQYNPANNSGWTTISTLPSTGVESAFVPGGFYLISTADFDTASAVDGDTSMTSGLALVGGHIRIMNGATEIDKIGWGTATVPEGNAKTTHAASGSLERKSFGGSTAVDMFSGGMDFDMGNGWDTADNSFDFVTQGIDTPQNTSSAPEVADFSGYAGPAGSGPMIMHMPLNIIPTGADLVLTAQIGDPVTPVDQITAELHYMTGDGTPTNNTAGDYSTVLGTHSANGYFNFTIAQAVIDASTTNGLYYYFKVVSTGGSAFMSADPSVDMGTYDTDALQEVAVAKAPFLVSVENSAGWTKYNITGTVSDDTPTAIGSVSVYLEGTSYSTTTAGDGTFTLANIKEGVYNLITTKAGYYDSWFNDIFLNSNTAIGTVTMFAGTGGGMTGDTEKPNITWTAPMDGMSGVPPGDPNFQIMIGFTKDLDATTFNNTNVYLTTDGTTPITSTVIYDNDTSNNAAAFLPMESYLGLVNAPAGGFNENATYYLVMTGAVRDTVGNSLQGNRSQGGHVISFTVGSSFMTGGGGGGGSFDPDATGSWDDFGSGAMMPPMVIGVMPSDGVDTVVPNAKINITFSDAMNSSSVTTSGNIKLYSISISNNVETSTLIPTTTTLDTSQTIATVTPSSNLAAGKYRVIVSGAPQSASGVFMGDPSKGQNVYSYNFYDSEFKVKSGTTADSGAPTILGSWPADSDTGISVNPGMLTFQFSEGMDPATITSNTITLKRGSTKVNGNVSYDPMARSASFTPSVVLATSSVYTLTATTGVTDSVGNALSANSVVSFTTGATGDTTNPGIMYANADEYSVAITFDEAMNSAKITDTSNWATSVLNTTNYIVKWGAPASVVGSGTVIDLADVDGSGTDAQLSYDSISNTITIKNLGLSYASGNDLYIDMASGNVSGTGATDLSGNALAGATSAQTPINSSIDTMGNLGPMTGGMMGGMMGPAMGDMGMMMAGVFPMNAMAGQTTTYFVDIPLTTALENGGSIILTYPTGFDVSGAKKDPFSPINDDINEWNTGTIAFGSAVETSGGANNDGVTVNASSRTVTITVAITGTPPANDYLHLDLAGIQNSSIPRDYDTSGYNVDIKVKKADGSLSESVTGMPFFINAGGSATLTGNITGIVGADVDGTGDTVTVFLGSPMTGPMESISTIANDGTGSYSFANLPAGQYMLFTDPTITLDSNDYSGMSMPEHITLADGANTKDVVITKEAAGGSKATITVNITGEFGTDNIDIFASSYSGFKVKTLTSAGSNPTATLYLPDGNWMIGMGPAMPKGPMAGPPPMPDWMPPMPVDVLVSGSGATVSEASGTADDGTIIFTISSADKQIIGYVKDDSNTAIADAEVFAYQPNGIGGMGAHTKTDTAGLFTLKVATDGIYSVGAYKPGLPGARDRSVLVATNTVAVDGNATADISLNGTLVTVSNLFEIKMKRPAYTISGKVTDGTNAVSYAPVWAYQNNGYEYADAMTDSSGNYILYVDNGTWVVNSYIPNYGDAESQTVTVNGANVTQNLSPDSSVTYLSIAGTVNIDDNLQTFMPIRAVEYNANGVYLGKEYHGMTDSAGVYSISAPAGIYRVDMWTPDYGEVERTDADDYANNPANVNLTSSSQTGVDIMITSGALNTITLAFTNALSTQEGFINIDGVDMTDVNNPVPTGYHKSIRINDLSAGSTVKLQDGNYFFYVDVLGYGGFEPNTASLDATTNTIIVASAPKTVTFTLLDTTDASSVVTLSGTVTNGGGNIEDAWVWIANPSTGYNQGTTTATDGTYSLTVPVLASGSYIVGTDKPGYLSSAPTTADLTDTNADGTVDATQDFTAVAEGTTISGNLFADAGGGISNSLDSGEEVANGWVYAEETTTGVKTHAPVNGSGSFSLGVTDGTWKIYGAADGYTDSQYSEAGTDVTLVVSGSDLISKDLKLATDVNWTVKSKSKPMTPASGGTVDDTGAGGTGVKLTIPPNALGNSSSAGNVSVTETSAVVETQSATPFGNKGKSISATDNSGQPITNFNDYVDMDTEYTKSDIDAEVVAGTIVDLSKLKGMKMSYFDSSKDDWVNMPTTRTVEYKTLSSDTEWKTYKGDADETGYEKFIDDALVDETFTAFEDYKITLTTSTNHFTVFGATMPTDSIAPSVPTGLSQTSGTGTGVVLDWADNSEADLLEYEIYRSTTTGVSKSSTQANSSKQATSTFTDSGLTAFTSYFYTVTAVDDSGNESTIATEVQICSTTSVSNGSISASCTITCDSGYTVSGNSCASSSSGGGGGFYSSPSSSTTTTTPTPDSTTTTTTTPTSETTTETATETVVESKPAKTVQQQAAEEFKLKVRQIVDEAVEIIKANVDNLLIKIGVKRDIKKEEKIAAKYVKKLIKNVLGLKIEIKNAMNNFIAYGTETTIKLGEGERAGVVSSYKSTYGKIPSTQAEWSDVIKIANGRWPSQIKQSAEDVATKSFKKIYLREPDRKNPNDDAAVVVMSYGLRPANRNLDSEKVSIKTFEHIYKYSPESASDWDIVRAIAYSGATR